MMPSEPRKWRSEQLDYIQAMLEQLRAMAQAEKCDMLAYLIEMAYLEANDIRTAQKQSQPRLQTSLQKRNASP